MYCTYSCCPDKKSSTSLPKGRWYWQDQRWPWRGESPTKKLNPPPPGEGEDKNSKTGKPRNPDFGSRINSSTTLSAGQTFPVFILTSKSKLEIRKAQNSENGISSSFLFFVSVFLSGRTKQLSVSVTNYHISSNSNPSTVHIKVV